MRSFSILNRRARALFAAVLIVFGATVPALVSAATVTTRSIELSSSTKSATAVAYNVKFTTASTATTTGAFVVDFCEEATIGATCTPPAGMAVAASPTTSSAHTVSKVDNNTVKVVLGATVGASAAIVADIVGFTNPSTTDTFFARIVTYADDTDATGYTSADPDAVGNHIDNGTVALKPTDGFGVSGSVLETMTFCASGAVVADDCSDVSDADLSLGNQGVLGNTMSTGTIYTKISTNAVGGAVVSLKSNASSCGGLVRQGATSNAAGCGIAPIGTPAATIADNAAQFGVLLALTGVTAGSNWSTTNYDVDYASDNLSGLTSTYGSEVYNTGGAPINAGSGNLTFGANISNVTPAGTYSAAFSLIATGKF